MLPVPLLACAEDEEVDTTGQQPKPDEYRRAHDDAREFDARLLASTRTVLQRRGEPARYRQVHSLGAEGIFGAEDFVGGIGAVEAGRTLQVAEIHACPASCNTEETDRKLDFHLPAGDYLGVFAVEMQVPLEDAFTGALWTKTALRAFSLGAHVIRADVTSRT